MVETGYIVIHKCVDFVTLNLAQALTEQENKYGESLQCIQGPLDTVLTLLFFPRFVFFINLLISVLRF